MVRPSSSTGAKEAYLPIAAPFSHAANLLALPNGDLLCVWYMGTGERDRNVSIALSRLDRKSKRWSQPIAVAHRDDWANQNPVLFRAPDGKILLLYDSQKHGSSEATAIVNELISEDQGHTWTGPTILFTQPGIYLRQPIVISHNDWLFPVYQERSGGVSSSSAGKDSSLVEVSRDSGKTWSGIEVPESGGLVQMSIVLPTQDGQFLAFFRSRYADWIYESKSTDGFHWEVPVRTSLPNNNSSIQAARLNDGHIVMVFNNSQAETGRTHPTEGSRKVLSIALSADNGKTWPWVRDLETGNEPPSYCPCEDPEYSYPSVTQSSNGKILVAFSFRKETIKFMTFDEGWIKQGSTVGIQAGNFNIY
jgi:predicted neuraminidase